MLDKMLELTREMCAQELTELEKAIRIQRTLNATHNVYPLGSKVKFIGSGKDAMKYKVTGIHYSHEFDAVMLVITRGGVTMHTHAMDVLPTT